MDVEQPVPEPVPEWVLGTRKRLSERHDAHVKEAAAKSARTKEEQHERLRATYPEYAQDLQRVKEAIQRTLPSLELNEIIWVSLKNKDGCAEVCIMGPMPKFLNEGRTNISARDVCFRLSTELAWSRQLGMTSGVLWTLAEDLCAWAESLSLEARNEESNACDVRIPGSHLYMVDDNEEVPPRGLSAGDYVVGIAVPLEPVEKRGRFDYVDRFGDPLKRRFTSMLQQEVAITTADAKDAQQQHDNSTVNRLPWNFVEHPYSFIISGRPPQPVAEHPAIIVNLHASSSQDAAGGGDAAGEPPNASM